jgi:tetratricopeptide (TPR) repeat protein
MDEATTPQRIFLFIDKKRAVILAFVFLISSASASNAHSSTDATREEAAPSSDFASIAADIKKSVKMLEYSDEVGQDFVDIVKDWHLVAWKNKIADSRMKLLHKEQAPAAVAKIEEYCLQVLYDKLHDEFPGHEGEEGLSDDLSKVLKERKPFCFGNCQLLYVLGISIGLHVRIASVLEMPADSSEVREAPAHVVNLIELSDGRCVLADLSFSVSKPFVFQDRYVKDGETWRLKDAAKSGELHRRIQLWNDKDIVACVHCYRGIDLHLADKYAEALPEYSAAIKLNPGYLHPYLWRGISYDNLGKTKKALEDFSKAIELNPSFAEVFVSRGTLNSKLGKDAESIVDYTKAIEIDPRYAEAYYSRGLVEQRSGDTDKALADMNKAISVDPKKACAYYARGLFIYRSSDSTKRSDDAISDSTKAIELNSEYAEAYGLRGCARFDKGDVSNAISDWAKAIKIDPRNPWYYYQRGTAFLAQEKYTETFSDLNKAIELDPKFALAYANRGWAHYAQHNLQEALSELNKSIVLSPNDASDHKFRAIVELDLGKKDEATKDLQKALQLDPKLKDEIEEMVKQHKLDLVTERESDKK